MKAIKDGDAIVYCQGAYGTTNGKTAHGLVRRTNRYRVLSVVDALHDGQDAGEVLDGVHRDIPVLASIQAAVQAAKDEGNPASHLVMGVAPDGGRLTPEMRTDFMAAIRQGLHLDSGLHDFVSEDPELSGLARQHGVVLRDVRKPPPRDQLHFFSGRIGDVKSVVVAILGTDSAVGKRTTAWLLVDALHRAGLTAEMVGTGQTAWMQGARYGVIMDALPNDFVAGEIEHAVVSAWDEAKPDVIVVEGQGSLMHPAYPGGLEILAAARPQAAILQHAPMRKEYDGFPGWPMDPISRQIRAIETVSPTPVVAVVINHEGIESQSINKACNTLMAEALRPTFDVLNNGADGLADLLVHKFPRLKTQRQASA
jgi:uncharacterized NAD-dependent epimerase/dehydratase family protein